MPSTLPRPRETGATRRHTAPLPVRGILLLAAALLSVASPAAAQAPYVPGAGDDWERRAPAQAGMDARLLEEAVEFARAHESGAPRDLEANHYLSFGREPFGEAVGPFKERGPQTGIVLRHGYVVAEWGDPDRVDMTFSVTKSFLSTAVGLAHDRGLIRSLDDPVRDYMPPVILPDGDGEAVPGRLQGAGTSTLFDSEHNRKITWDHLLRQTSDWAGVLWGKPDWADRPSGEPSTWLSRPRHEPGSTYEYNDVRVNLLALAALQVWRRSLPTVLRELVMDPIGASSTWRWYGYENSWVTVDGQRIQSVSGGGHWGGGMFISARDQARFGLLTLRRGRWGDREILSEQWVRLATTPTPAQRGYGFMNWFLNTDRSMIPAAPETAFAHRGAGTNVVYVDPEHDLVLVARWIQGGAVAELVERVLASIAAAADGPSRETGPEGLR